MILLGLGSNLPGRFSAPEKNLESVLTIFEHKALHVKVRSRIWRSAPVPAADQPDFRNMVVQIKTALNPDALMTTLHEIEKEFGRVRKIKNEPRILDIDILSYNDEVWGGGNLILPHPRLQERAFVLYPLQEIAPNWIHPVTGKNIEEMIENLPEGQIIRPL